MKLLFVVPYPVEAASTRYRVDQYLPYLAAAGIDVTVERFVASSEFFQMLYQPGFVLQKGQYYLSRTLQRLATLAQVHHYDAVFVQKEALPLGPPIFELLSARLGCHLIYDFDDAVYLPHASAANQWISWVKNPGKVGKIVAASSHVIVGNEELASYARCYNDHVTIIPSSVDMNRYRASPRLLEDAGSGESVVIGWVGSNSTVRYLTPLAPLFRELVHSLNVRIRVVGAEPDLPGVDADYRPWSLSREIEDLHGFDIGVMPLTDDPWTRGKGGFKAIQYMGVGLPVVASPVGINRDIIAHGASGYLASTMDEWRAALTTLVGNARLRRFMGQTGRSIVAERYSTQVNGPRLLEVLTSLSA